MQQIAKKLVCLLHSQLHICRKNNFLIRISTTTCAKCKHSQVSKELFKIVDITMPWPWKPECYSMKVIDNVIIRPNVYDFLLVYNSNRRPISYRFRLQRPFNTKFAHFFNQHVFCARLKRFRLQLGIDAGIRKLQWWGYRAVKDIWRYLQPSG